MKTLHKGIYLIPTTQAGHHTDSNSRFNCPFLNQWCPFSRASPLGVDHKSRGYILSQVGGKISDRKCLGWDNDP